MTIGTPSVCEWIRSLPNTSNVRPCRVTIKGQTWEGAYYEEEREWQQGMDGVQRGEHKAGDKYVIRRIYLLGDRPVFNRERVCFPSYEGLDWYVSGYCVTFKPEQKKYHPFGKSFQILPWEIEGKPDCKIGSHELHPYLRVPMTVEFIEETAS